MVYRLEIIYTTTGQRDCIKGYFLNLAGDTCTSAVIGQEGTMEQAIMGIVILFVPRKAHGVANYSDQNTFIFWSLRISV